MKQKLIFIALFLLVINLIKGQEKVYFDLDGRETKNISSAVEYIILEKSTVGKDSLFKKTVYFISGQKKSENSYLNEYKKGKIKESKFCGEKWEWFLNGNIHLKALYKDDQLDGEFFTYWTNGLLRRKDIFEKGKLIEGNCYDSIGNKLTKYFPYETLPEFPGGEAELFKFISYEIKYPIKAMENNIQGKVLTQFYIETDGKITDIRIIKNVNYYLDIEALRVIRAMPTNWIPATLEGQKVRYKYTLPIVFRLE